MLVSAYEKETGVSDFNAKQGTVTVKEVSEIEAEMQEESTDSTESISVDATGVDGKLEEGEIGQDLSEESTEETSSTPSTESAVEKDNTAYQGGYTPEELDKMAEDIMKEIARDNGWTDSSESSETPPTTYTRSDGVTVTVTPADPSKDEEYTFGQGGEMPDYLKGDFI